MRYLITHQLVRAIILFTVWGSLYGQPAKFRRLGINEGLSQSSVYDLKQDRLGFVWIATADGLNRYDGYEFFVYRVNPEDSLRSLRQNSIWTLGVDSLDNLWVGLMSGGLDRIDGAGGEVRHFGHRSDDSTSLSSNRVRVIHCDGRGFVWVGTADAGLNRIDQSTLVNRRVPRYGEAGKGVFGRRIKAILEDGHEHLLVATADGGLTRLEPVALTGQRIPLLIEDRPFSETIETVYLDGRGTLWISTTEAGLYRSRTSYEQWLSNRPDTPAPLRLESFPLSPTPESAPANTVVKSIVEDHRGNLWFGTFTAGLFRLNPEEKTLRQFVHHPFDPQSLSNNQIFALMLDRTGILWVGTNGGGISLLDNRLNQIEDYRLHPETAFSLPDKMVRAVINDDYGGIWVGTSHGGLSRIDLISGSVQPIFPLASTGKPAFKDVRALLIDRQNHLWVGTYGDGLWRMEPAVGAFARNKKQRVRFRSYPADGSPEPGKEIWCLLEDQSGRLWMGSNDGLLRYDPARNEWKHYPARAGDSTALGHPIVRALWLSGDSSLWIGTYGGLYRLPLGGEAEKQGRFTRHAGHHIGALWEYPRGYLWLGTFGEGLNLLEMATGRVHQWTRLQGLPSDYILGIRHDDLGGLWVSTISGLARLVIHDLLPPQAGQPLKIRVFTQGDGLQSNEFNAGAVHRDKAGYLYFGGVEGLNRFHPAALIENEPLFPPLITGVRVFDRPITQAVVSHKMKRLVLSHRENSLSISFSSLAFHNPAGIRYRFRLVGAQERWSEISGTNQCTYSALAPGNYRFEVMAVSRDGQQYSEITTLEIILVPAFWQTLWFRLLLVALVVAGAWEFFRYRLRKERELQRTRAQIAADLHDEVASSLASIRLYSEVIARQLKDHHAQTREILKRIRYQAQDVTESIAEIIWSVDPRHDRLGELLNRINDFAAQTLPAAGIAYRFHGDHLPVEQRLSPQQRRALYLMLKEAIANAMRHSGAEKLTLRCKQEGAHLEFVLEDNGCGLNLQQIQPGRGLENMRRRAEELGAELQIDGGPRGTRVVIRLKIT